MDYHTGVKSNISLHFLQSNNVIPIFLQQKGQGDSSKADICWKQQNRVGLPPDALLLHLLLTINE